MFETKFFIILCECCFYSMLFSCNDRCPTKKAIIECLMVYDALQKRTAYLDALARGLEVLGVKTALSLFPEIFKAVFV